MRRRFDNFSISLTSATSMTELDWYTVPRPSRIGALFFYMRIFLRWLVYRNRSSFPYISGDAFVACADLQVTSLHILRKLSELKLQQSGVIFIRGDLFNQFLAFHSNSLAPNVVLIIGNSDFNLTELPDALSHKEFTLFAQNSSINDQRVVPIPIGVENIKFGTHGRVRHLQKTFDFSERLVLFGPFGDTHPTRKKLTEIALTMPDVFFVPPLRLSPHEYVRLSAGFKYVFCIRGNGVDTHRLWETLYRGQVPIVIDCEWSKQISAIFPQIIRIKDFSDLQILLPRLDFIGSDFIPEVIPQLWMPYWLEKVSLARLN